MVIAKQAGRVERVRLWLPAAAVVPIKALPAAPLHLIELPEQMKPGNSLEHEMHLIEASELEKNIWNVEGMGKPRSTTTSRRQGRAHTRTCTRTHRRTELEKDPGE